MAAIGLFSEEMVMATTKATTDAPSEAQAQTDAGTQAELERIAYNQERYDKRVSGMSSAEINAEEAADEEVPAGMENGGQVEQQEPAAPAAAPAPAKASSSTTTSSSGSSSS